MSHIGRGPCMSKLSDFLATTGVTAWHDLWMWTIDANRVENRVERAIHGGFLNAYVGIEGKETWIAGESGGYGRKDESMKFAPVGTFRWLHQHSNFTPNSPSNLHPVWSLSVLSAEQHILFILCLNLISYPVSFYELDRRSKASGHRLGYILRFHSMMMRPGLSHTRLHFFYARWWFNSILEFGLICPAHGDSNDGLAFINSAEVIWPVLHKVALKWTNYSTSCFSLYGRHTEKGRSENGEEIITAVPVQVAGAVPACFPP